MIMSIDIKGLSANEAERLYNQGRLSKRELTAWVRLSAKLSGRIYKPVYRTGAVHDRVWLQRLEGAEEKLYAKRKARHASRDMHSKKTLAEAHRALEADRNANELVLYAENTGELYEDFKKTSRMLRLQYQRGNYKRHAALVVWRIFARRAAKRYEREIKNSHFHVEKGIPLAAEYWEAALRDELLRSSNDPGRRKKTRAKLPVWRGHLPKLKKNLPKQRRRARRDPGDHYIVQGSYSGGRLTGDGEVSFASESNAIEFAKKLLRSSHFEGESVRVITSDGELVWADSLKKRERLTRKRRDPGEYERGQTAWAKRILGDERYAERHHFRGWNINPDVLQEPRLFAKVFPELSAEDHRKLSDKFGAKMRTVTAQHQKWVARGEKTYGADGALISGGFREHWPEGVKETIRRLARAAATYGAAYAAHQKAAKLRNRTRATWQGR